MISYGIKVENGSTVTADICVIGGGPAGITIALELASTKKRILVLEAGTRDKSKRAREPFYRGENIGLPYDIARTRSRRFGGTTDRWAGYTALMDRVDFDARPWVPHSGWPIAYDDVIPYYKRAHKLLKSHNS